MLAYLLSIGAFCAFIVHAVLLVGFMHGRQAKDSGKLMGRVEGLFRAGDRYGAAQELTHLAPRTPAKQLLVFMLGLELPQSSSRGARATGYRSAPALTSFEDACRKQLDAEVRDILDSVRTASIAAMASGPVAALLCTAALIYGASLWRVSSMCGITFSVVGSIFATAMTRDCRRGLNDVRTRIEPLLIPMEQMNEDQRRAAANARDELSSMSAGSGAPIASTLAVVVVGWVATAWFASGSMP
jgi:hypothetical protein